MSDYPEFTPTTEQVRSAYAHDPEAEYRDPVGFPAMQRENLRAFDRWLAAHDAEKDATIAELRLELAKQEDSLALARFDTEELHRIRTSVEEPEPSDQVKQLIRDMTDPDDCSFDHNGGCQAHGYLSLQPGEKCPHAEAKELLASWVPVKQEGAESDG
ncbi:hypothetical protein [Microbacterium sp. Leaf320]|uniref:hypothetical protein n=1 Tax=Microbacterium sp. Leaf320 TaxID=1736334 RepID=UPI0006FBFAF7|nr:hypothetical protein [Microbacterium sp. Leaf320]KQQ65063.1 hypothetical protein ASF63_13915 [Microbacterium sp. Leaf320]